MKQNDLEIKIGKTVITIGKALLFFACAVAFLSACMNFPLSFVAVKEAIVVGGVTYNGAANAMVMSALTWASGTVSSFIGLFWVVYKFLEFTNSNN